MSPNTVYLEPDPEPEGGRHLVVSTPARVQAAPVFAYRLYQLALNERMNVLGVGIIKIILVCGFCLEDMGKAADDLIPLFRIDHASCCQGICVRYARADIGNKKPLVYMKRVIKPVKYLVRAYQRTRPKLSDLVFSALRAIILVNPYAQKIKQVGFR